MNRQRILVVDDELALRELVSDYLTAHEFEVATAADGAGMRAEFARARPDLVILDVNLVNESGYDLARELVAKSRVGILMLTAVGDLEHRLKGLATGVDDYMPKPFEPRELLARVRAVLRRLAPEEPRPTDGMPLGRCVLHADGRRLVDREGRDVHLTAMEFELISAFIRHPRQVLSRDRLSQLAHSRDLDPGDRSIDIRITRLRKKIEFDPDKPRVLLTVRGEGYVYEPMPA